MQLAPRGETYNEKKMRLAPRDETYIEKKR
jgi:hypothetical protein